MMEIRNPTEKKPIKTLQIVTTRFAANGITSCVLAAMEGMGDEASCDVVALNEPDAALRSRCGGDVFVLPMRNRNPVTYVRKLAEIVRRGNYDIVHAHGNSCTLLTEMIAARQGGARVRIAHAHNTSCKQQLLHAVLRPLFDRAYTVGAACGRAAGRFLFHDKRFTVLNNGIDTARFAFNAKERARLREEMQLEDRRVLLHVGSFNAQKNQNFLLAPFKKAYEKDPSLCLLLVGAGERLSAVRAETEHLGLPEDAVRFLGRRNDVDALLSAADVFVLPSLFEGFPIAMIEAQCAGLACLAADTITTDAKICAKVRFLPLKAEEWTEAMLDLAIETEGRGIAADAVRWAGFDKKDTAKALLGFYRSQAEKAAPLKKLFIMTHNMAGGGCERVIAQLANRYAAEGIDCTVLTEYRHESYFPLDPRVKLRALTEDTVCRTKDIPRVYLALRSLVRKEKPDLVLAMPEKVNVWTVLFLLGSGVPVVVSERNDPNRHPESRIKRMLRTLVYPFSDGFVFQTQQQAAFFSERIRKRGKVLDNPLELSRIPQPAELHDPVIVTATRLDPQKNLPLLIQAFAKFYRSHSDWRLIIYGEGAERTRLEAMAAKLPMGAVNLPGASTTLLEEIRSAGMFVLSSDFEGMPNALIEAMAVGLPCVATDCPAGGPASLIVSGVNGLLVPVGEAKTMAKAMCRIADDPEFAESLGAHAAEIKTRLDVDTVAEKWREYLERVIKQAKKI